MTILILTPAERSAKRSQAHGLKPVVLIGDQGVTEAVLAEIDRALCVHGLIKVRVAGEDRDQRAAAQDTICDRLGCAPVQAIGRILVLWREPRDLPRDESSLLPPAKKKSAPRQVKVVVPSTSPTHRPKVKRVTVLGNERLTSTGRVKKAKPRRSSIKKIRLG